MSQITFYKQSAGANREMKRRNGWLPPLKIGPATLGVITIIIILLMSLLYLVQANSTATKGYEIEKEQERMKTLESQTDKLELEMAKLRSTKELNGIPQKLNLIPLSDEEMAFIQFDKAMALVGTNSPNNGRDPKR